MPIGGGAKGEFRRLAFLPGGGTLEAARAIAASVDQTDVIASLTALVDSISLRQKEAAPASALPHLAPPTLPEW